MLTARLTAALCSTVASLSFRLPGSCWICYFFLALSSANSAAPSMTSGGSTPHFSEAHSSSVRECAAVFDCGGAGSHDRHRGGHDAHRSTGPIGSHCPGHDYAGPAVPYYGGVPILCATLWLVPGSSAVPPVMAVAAAAPPVTFDQIC